MTATSGVNREFEDYVDAWVQMMISIWKEKMNALGIDEDGELANSLNTEVIRQSGGNASKINHVFKYYGIYVARGTGKGYRRGNAGDLDFTPKRKPRPWIFGKYWYSKNKLLIEMLEQTGKYYVVILRNVLSSRN